MMNELTILNMGRDELKRLICEAVKEVTSMRTSRPVHGFDEGEALICVDEAAKLTGLAVNTIYEKTRTREIPHFKKGKRLYFRPSELTAWIGAGRVRTREELDAMAATKLLEIQSVRAAR
jgi:excisionase family DNA binding protein